MKVFHITTGLNDGGAEAVLYRLATKNEPTRHHVISLMDEGKYGPLLRKAGTKVTCLNMPRGRLTLGGLWHLWRLLRQERPKVVQTWMYHGDLVGGVIARLAGVERVCWGIHHTTLERGKSARSTIFVARLNARLSRWVPHAIVCCAEKTRVVHAELGYSADKMVVIPNGYDLQRFQPDADSRKRLRQEWRVSDDMCLLGLVGRFDPQKDHANLIAALAHLKQSSVEFRCVLVGTGLNESNITVVNWIAQHGLVNQVVLLGQRNDIPDVMNALDLHLLSSSAEAFPNVLAEAMACGTPCVTTDVGDAALIVGNTGWVVPPGSPEALAKAVQAACQERLIHPPDWSSRQNAARQRIVAHFSIKRMINGYKQVWSGMVDA